MSGLWLIFPGLIKTFPDINTAMPQSYFSKPRISPLNLQTFQSNSPPRNWIDPLKSTLPHLWFALSCLKLALPWFNLTTGRPKAMCGQRYPMPCFGWLWIGVGGSEAAALKGMKSWRTQGGLLFVHLSVCPPPPGTLSYLEKKLGIGKESLPRTYKRRVCFSHIKIPNCPKLKNAIVDRNKITLAPIINLSH